MRLSALKGLGCRCAIAWLQLRHGRVGAEWAEGGGTKGQREGAGWRGVRRRSPYADRVEDKRGELLIED
jgi:hypothetical protein